MTESHEDDKAFPWDLSSQATYDNIGLQHKNLTPEEVEEVVHRLQAARDELAYEIGENPLALQILYNEWRRRFTAKTQTGSVSVAKMGIDYNSNEKGRNAKVKERISGLFDLIDRGSDFKGIHVSAMRLHPNFLYQGEVGTKIGKCVSIHSPRAVNCIREIEESRRLLCASVDKMISEIAHKRHVGLAGDVITMGDLVQEGRLAVYEASGTFGLGNAKWSSFAWIRAKGAIENYAVEESRTVYLPRTKLQYRWAPIAEAQTELGTWDYIAITVRANELRSETQEEYTLEEVDKALQFLMMAKVITLSIYPRDDREADHSPSNGLVLVDSSAKPNEAFLQDERRIKLDELLQEYTSEEEYWVLTLRWGLRDDDPKSMEETANIYRTKFPYRTMNKGKVKDIETKVMHRLRNSNPEDLRLLWED